MTLVWTTLVLGSVGPAQAELAFSESVEAEPTAGVVVGTTVAVDPRDPVAQRAAGWRQTLQHPGASFLKPRFAQLVLRPGDRLWVLDGAGRTVEMLTGFGPRDGYRFWGLAVPGDSLELVLEAQRPYDRAPFRVDRLVIGARILAVDSLPGDSSAGDSLAGEPWWDHGTGALPTEADSVPVKTVCGPADFDDAICSMADAPRWANLRATAGILAVGEDPGDDALFCTGVNVSPRNRLLTSAQCLATTADCQNAEVIFGFYRTGCNDGSPTAAWEGFRCGETVALSPFGTCEPAVDALGVSLHTMLGEPTATFGYSDPDPSALVSGDALYIAQHAAGRPLEVASGSGGDVVVDGLTLRYFGTLDTEGSSTGAPIFREVDDRLVGVHHCGGCDDALLGNRGVPMSAIEAEIADELCTDTLVLEPAGPSVLEQIQGNFDAVLDPGETWGLRPRVRNIACGTDATGVTATLDVAAGSAPIELLDTVADFGAVSAGGLSTALAPLRFRLASDTPCAGAVVLDLLAIDATGAGPFAGEASYLDTPIGAGEVAIPLSEGFDAGIPGTWTVIDGASQGGDASTWTTTNPGMRDLGLAEPFAIADSDAFGPGDTMDEELRTPTLDLSTVVEAILRFRHVFEHLAGGGDEQGNVDVRSTLTGGAWTNLVNFSGGDAEGEVELDLSAQAGASDVELRFHYFGADFDFYWAVDDVHVTTTGPAQCRIYDPLFTDGFESGDTLGWSSTMP